MPPPPSLHRAAAVVRDRISIDSWRILNGLRLELAPPLSADAEVPLGDVLSALNRLVLDLSAFAGMGTESMTRGPGWRFLDMGRRLERAQPADGFERPQPVHMHGVEVSHIVFLNPRAGKLN